MVVVAAVSSGLVLAAAGAQIVWPILIETVPAIAVVVLVYLAELISKIDRQSLTLFMQSVTLRRTDNLMRKVVDKSFNGVLTIGENGEIETVNAAARSMFGLTEEGIVGTNVAELVPELSANENAIGSILATGQHEVIGLRTDGTKFLAELSVNDLEDEEHSRFVAIVRDISEQKRYEEELRHQALNDSLTGLPNRTLLMNRIEHALNVALREGKPVALLLIDLDRFKEINDTLGHHVGDMLLKDVAERLSAPLRKTDTIARLGGDEFSVLLPAVSNNEMALEVGERTVVQLQEPFNVEGMLLEVGASIGVAVFPDHAKTAAELLKCSDVAMYVAKAGQKSVVLYDQEQDKNSVRNLALTGELRQAITEDHLDLFVQPKVDLAGNRVCAAEALLRWQHTAHGFIPPDEFAMQAELTGLIEPLTRWALIRALGGIAAWHQKGLDLAIAVNLSSRNLMERDLPQLVLELVQAHRIEPDRLTLEITESAIMLDPETALEVLKELDDLGFRLSIDDFGTGYSSLGYLKTLPVDELKIDKSFVLPMCESASDLMIVRSTVDLAHNLGLKVVAEGIESQAHVDKLTELGCDVGQGFFISRPIPLDQFDEWIKETDWPPRRLPVDTPNFVANSA